MYHNPGTWQDSSLEKLPNEELYQGTCYKLERQNLSENEKLEIHRVPVSLWNRRTALTWERLC